MVTSICTVAIMITIDIYIYVFLNQLSSADFSYIETIIIVLGRLLQYHSVNMFLYFFLYWPYRRTFRPKNATNYDVSIYSEYDANELSIINKKESLTPEEEKRFVKEIKDNVV